ncbi:hypothetical protein NXX54_04685 [Bacteroides sp. BFG-638]|uniref:Uncharacterized protein n=1 Tax=Bacteroides vicugnae TaxID=3037989 RepID=A0ABU5HRV5_9BACE|nr:MULTISPECIES: hypothetical protein [Bacteroidales]MEB3374564.1 hypothetical protein [Bacteroides sp. CR5/BHMF/2]MCS2947709.1 hypothetical protein [Bacteroides sp. BFG-638]MCS3311332.1 hypothetical protein [Bacteroides sp. BFG-637]MDC2613467.1 hypothetical protein [Bacteroides ovatus]MDC2632456.1 hypothetical protein [Bacteroides ovatus]
MKHKQLLALEVMAVCIYRFSSFLSGDAGGQYTYGYSFGRGW